MLYTFKFLSKEKSTRNYHRNVFSIFMNIKTQQACAISFYLGRQLREQGMEISEHVPHLLPPLSLSPYMLITPLFTIFGLLPITTLGFLWNPISALLFAGWWAVQRAVRPQFNGPFGRLFIANAARVF